MSKSTASMMIIDEDGGELCEGYHNYYAPAYCAPLPHHPPDPAQIAQLERDTEAAQADASYTAFCNGHEPVGL